MSRATQARKYLTEVVTTPNGAVAVTEVAMTPANGVPMITEVVATPANGPVTANESHQPTNEWRGGTESRTWAEVYWRIVAIAAVIGLWVVW